MNNKAHILTVSLLSLCFLIANRSSAAETPTVYTVGIVPQYDAREIHAIWRPILNLLEERTGERFTLKGSSSIAAFEQDFTEREFHFAYMNPYHLLAANRVAGYTPLVRDGDRKLTGILVVKRDSAITSPKELDGKQVAFPSPNALGASLLIRRDLEDKFKVKVRPIYVKTHDSVYLNVLLDETDAGGGVEKTLSRQKAAYKNALRILHRTEPVNPHPFAVLPSVPDEVKIKVQNAFLEIAETTRGRELLAMIPIKKMDIATMDDYLPLKNMRLERFYNQL